MRNQYKVLAEKYELLKEQSEQYNVLPADTTLAKKRAGSIKEDARKIGLNKLGDIIEKTNEVQQTIKELKAEYSQMFQNEWNQYEMTVDKIDYNWTEKVRALQNNFRNKHNLELLFNKMFAGYKMKSGDMHRFMEKVRTYIFSPTTEPFLWEQIKELSYKLFSNKE